MDTEIVPTKQPALSYNRIWSSPVTGVSDTTLIASVIAKPTFDDILQCCLHYGVDRVRQVYLQMLAANELSAIGARTVGRILANVEIGFARASTAARRSTNPRANAGSVPRKRPVQRDGTGLMSNRWSKRVPNHLPKTR